MNAKQAKYPQLRFIGFTGAWKQRNIKEISKVFIGLVTSMTENYRDNGTLLIRNSDIKSGHFEFSKNPIYLDEVFAEKNASRRLKIGDVITVHTGDIGTSAVVGKREDGSIGFATINTRPDKSVLDSDYLSTYFNTTVHKYWAIKMSTGDGRSNYNLYDFNRLIVPLPNIEEQQKIGTFFQQLDNLITLHQRKLAKLKKLKQGYLQKLFPKDGSKFPQLRFSGFADAWEQRKLSDLTERVTRNNKTNESNRPLTISAQDGLVDQNDFFDKQIASHDVSGYFMVNNGEFAYNKSYSNGYPWGAIKRLDKYDMGVLSTIYIIFRPTNVSSQFLA